MDQTPKELLSVTLSIIEVDDADKVIYRVTFAKSFKTPNRYEYVNHYIRRS